MVVYLQDYGGKKLNYFRSDLACEMDVSHLSAEDGEYSEDTRDGIGISRLHIKSSACAKRFEKPVGRYVTVSCRQIHSMEAEEFKQVCGVVAREIRRVGEYCTGKKIDESFSVMAVGLGNEEITPDAIGPLAVNQLTVTRHIKEFYPSVYRALNMCELSAFSPGVLGKTGIETAELIRGASSNVNPDLVVILDALAAGSCERLASTIQISDAGINPGSGIGNRRKEISRKTLGIPTISVGVPTVVNSATLVYDALTRAGIKEANGELIKVLENGKSFFVSPKEIDLIVRDIAAMLSRALEEAFSLT